MATTTNFGWETPDDTDLVKDGAAAIRTALGGVDTSFVDLKGGTTGQVLAKASATDLDFTWATDASGIPATIFDAKGDIIAASAADTAARLAVGTNNTVLTADSSTATGLKWAAPAATGASWSLVASAATTSGTTVTISGLSGYDKLYFMAAGTSFASNAGAMKMTFNSDTGTNYVNVGFTNSATTTYNDYLQGSSMNLQSLTYVYFSEPVTANTNSGNLLMSGCNGTGFKQFQLMAAGHANGGTQMYLNGIYKGTSVISSVSLTSTNAATFDAGTLYVYGSN